MLVREQTSLINVPDSNREFVQATRPVHVQEIEALGRTSLCYYCEALVWGSMGDF